MKKIRSNMVGVESGVAHLFSDFAEGGEMWAGTGERHRRVKVVFSEPFLTPPAVQVGLTLWDISNKANIRADLAAEDITETGFTIVFTTWGDTQVARMRANWMAIGEAADDDMWDV